MQKGRERLPFYPSFPLQGIKSLSSSTALDSNVIITTITIIQQEILCKPSFYANALHKLCTMHSNNFWKERITRIFSEERR
jgi:hypothetical protein